VLRRLGNLLGFEKNKEVGFVMVVEVVVMVAEAVEKVAAAIVVVVLCVFVCVLSVCVWGCE
jgi:hypothetical protein